VKTKQRENSSNLVKVAVDIGSTIIKIAQLDHNDAQLSQQFFTRDFDLGVAPQVKSLLEGVGADEILMCSSANGGLRAGIISLTEHYSGIVVQNQALNAGANPLFVKRLSDEQGDMRFVDVLIVCGGIDCSDAPLFESMIENLTLVNFKFGSLIYAGNSYFADSFRQRFPEAVVIANPLGGTLTNGSNSVFEALRNAYLEDLVYKEGISELNQQLSMKIRPTPEVVSSGFHRILSNRSNIKVTGASLLFDVGGATTDIHYTVEIVRDDSLVRPGAASSIARYVFTDLGIVASRDSTLQQMRSHPLSYEFLNLVLTHDVRETYQLLREGEYVPSPEVLSYACLFLSLDRFSHGKGSGLPVADLNKVSQIILTGGATQNLSEAIVANILRMFFSDVGVDPAILIDKKYQVWIDGITWFSDVVN